MRWLLGLVTAVSMLFGAFGFIVSGTSGQRVDILKGFIFGAIPAVVGLYVLFRLFSEAKLQMIDCIAIAVAFCPIVLSIFGVVSADSRGTSRGAGRGPGSRLEVKRSPNATQTADSPE